MAISKQQRWINIIDKALEVSVNNEFTFDGDESLSDIVELAEKFLIENTDHEEDECEVTWSGSGCQNVYWTDGYGFEFESDGEIVRYSDHWAKAPDTKVIHNTVVDSYGTVIDLYYLVGETDENAPDGYFFNQKTKKHSPIN